MVLDEMEIWQVGAALGLTSDDDPQQGPSRDPASLVPQEWLEARARAIAEGRPLPDPPMILPKGRVPTTEDLFSQVPQIGSQ